MNKKIAIIGAGPAGLTAAYHLAEKNYQVDIFETRKFVGGMCASINLWGAKVDLGPHRFFSSDPRVNNFWLKIIENQYKMIDRKTRIYYKNKFFDYPLKPFDALTKLGLVESIKCLISYLNTFFIKKKLTNFEDWITKKFGKRLYEIFFRSYSEKLWGISCKKLSADFAAQRIKKFSLMEAIKSPFKNNNIHKTLVDEFAYPNGGTGNFYEKLSEKFKKFGGNIFLDTKIEKIKYCNNEIILEINNELKKYDYLISTMPINDLVSNLNPDEITKIAIKELKFRNTLLVYLHISVENIFNDQWIYINSNDIKSGRISNFNNWQQENQPNHTILCFEYWFNDEDEIWNNNNKILEVTKNDVKTLDMFDINKIQDFKIVSIKKCYPVYDTTYKENLEIVKKFLDKFTNIIPIGRYGSFKYNNQDHSILMGILASEKIIGNNKINLWEVNTDYEFQEKAIITKTGLKKI